MATRKTKPVAAATAPQAPAVPMYAVTAKGAAYTGRTATKAGRSNAAAWQALQAACAAGPVTKAQLMAAAPAGHKCFVGYAIKSGWLAPVTP
jgi:hypothetical protein